MTTRTSTCTARVGDRGEACGGEIRPSYIGPAPIIRTTSAKDEITHPAACQQCGKTYADIVSVPMTLADLDMVADRLSASTRQELGVTATELTPGCYEVEMTEDRARDLASKSANLGLVAIASKVRQELDGLTIQRRQR
jgi:hypothetical protein